MRILIAVYARGVAGGVEAYARTVAPALIARGHDLALVCEYGYDSAGGAIDAAPYSGCQRQLEVQEMGEDAVVAEARDWRPDLVWIHGLQSNSLESSLLDLAPAVLFAHNYDGLCATGTRYHAWPAPRPCGRVFGAACIPVHAARHCGIANPIGFVASYRHHARRKHNFARYRRLLVASRHMASELARGGVATERIRLCPYPLTADRGPAPKPRPRPGSELLMLSRLTAPKGGMLLLSAMATVEKALARRLHLVIAGEGPERWTLVDTARRRNLAVDFPGWIHADQRSAYLSVADLIVVPSIWPEPFGLVGTEAGAAGVPAVAFASGGITDWLEPGIGGELAPADPPTADGLAAALMRALADRDHTNRLRQGAWHASARFDLGRHLLALESAFQEAVASA